jgi:integrase/recombinase XerD
VVAAVAALPMLPPADPADRYSIRRLTAAWLGEVDSEHTRRGYFRDLAAFLGWCEQQRLDPLAARATDLGQYRVAVQLGTTAGTDQRRHAAPTPTPATVAGRLSAVSSWYRYLVANSDGRVATNPMVGSVDPASTVTPPPRPG